MDKTKIKVPKWIRVISVLYYITAVLALIAAIIVIFFVNDMLGYVMSPMVGERTSFNSLPSIMFKLALSALVLIKGGLNLIEIPLSMIVRFFLPLIGGADGATESLVAFDMVLFRVLGVVYIGFAALAFFIGRGLQKAQRWARIAVIILTVLGVLSFITSAIFNIIAGMLNMSIFNGIIIVDIFGATLNLAIGYYLIFNKNAKSFFASKKREN